MKPCSALLEMLSRPEPLDWSKQRGCYGQQSLDTAELDKNGVKTIVFQDMKFHAQEQQAKNLNLLGKK